MILALTDAIHHAIPERNWGIVYDHVMFAFGGHLSDIVNEGDLLIQRELSELGKERIQTAPHSLSMVQALRPKALDQLLNGLSTDTLSRDDEPKVGN